MKRKNTVLKEMCKCRKLKVGGNKRKLVDRLLGEEEPRVRRRFCGHGVSPVAPLPTDAIAGGSVEKDGDVVGDDEYGRDDDGGPVCMLVDEDVGQVDCRLENGHGFAAIPTLDSEVYIQQIAEGGSGGDDGHVDGSVSAGCVEGEAGDQQIGGAASGSLLAPCGGCGMPVGGVHRCP